MPGQIETIEVGAKLFFRGPFVTNGEATPADPTHGFVIRDGTKSSESDFSRTRTRWRLVEPPCGDRQGAEQHVKAGL